MSSAEKIRTGHHLCNLTFYLKETTLTEEREVSVLSHSWTKRSQNNVQCKELREIISLFDHQYLNCNTFNLWAAGIEMNE